MLLYSHPQDRFDPCSGLIIPFIQSFVLSEVYYAIYSNYLSENVILWTSEMKIENSF
jgi:hypothetical protein